MYKQIKKHEKVVDMYARKLMENSIVTQEDYEVSECGCVCVCARASTFIYVLNVLLSKGRKKEV